MNGSVTLLSPSQLRKAATIKEKIDQLETELNRLLQPLQGRDQDGVRVATVGRKRHKMSAAGRARLSAIAKARWKKSKALGKSTL